MKHHRNLIEDADIPEPLRKLREQLDSIKWQREQADKDKRDADEMTRLRKEILRFGEEPCA